MRYSRFWSGLGILNSGEALPTPTCPQAAWLTAGILTTASLFLEEAGHPFISGLLGFFAVLLVIYGAFFAVAILSAIIRK